MSIVEMCDQEAILYGILKLPWIGLRCKLCGRESDRMNNRMCSTCADNADTSKMEEPC